MSPEQLRFTLAFRRLLRLSELGIDEVPVGANPLDSAAAARRAALAEHAKTQM